MQLKARYFLAVLKILQKYVHTREVNDGVFGNREIQELPLLVSQFLRLFYFNANYFSFCL